MKHKKILSDKTHQLKNILFDKVEDVKNNPLMTLSTVLNISMMVGMHLVAKRLHLSKTDLKLLTKNSNYIIQSAVFSVANFFNKEHSKVTSLIDIKEKDELPEIDLKSFQEEKLSQTTNNPDALKSHFIKAIKFFNSKEKENLEKQNDSDKKPPTLH